MLPDDPEDSHDANRLNLLHYLYYNSHAQNLFWSTHEGYIDVGDFMLVNIFGCWRISILVTSYGCCCPTLMLKDRGCWWQNRPKLSPTSQSCPQLILSPTSVANVDLATHESCLDPTFDFIIFDPSFASLSKINRKKITRLSKTNSFINSRFSSIKFWERKYSKSWP